MVPIHMRNPSDPFPDLAEKLAQIATVAVERGVRTVVLRDPANLCWLLNARVHVPQSLHSACLEVVVDTAPDGQTLRVVTNTIEAPRLQDTELAGLPAEWTVLPWWAQREGAVPSGTGVGSDRATGRMTDLAGDLAVVRRQLTAVQQGLLRDVCLDAAAATTAAAHQLTPGTTEYGAAAILAHALLDRGLDPVVLLVAGDEHMETHRHPLPTTDTLGQRCMLVCCASRHGLIASITRIVAFGPPKNADRYLALLEVERRFLDATRTGARIGDVVAEGISAYPVHGFADDEWHRHHQGGLTGFVPRKFPAHPGSDEVIPERGVVAWNPSGHGWKVEDTCLVGASGPTPLVHDADWPTLDVGGRSRPDILVR